MSKVDIVITIDKNIQKSGVDTRGADLSQMSLALFHLELIKKQLLEKMEESNKRYTRK